MALSSFVNILSVIQSQPWRSIYCDYKVMYKSQSSGRRCSIDQSKCLQTVNDPPRSISENVFVLNHLNGLAVLQLVVCIFILGKIFISGFTHQDS